MTKISDRLKIKDLNFSDIKIGDTAYFRRTIDMELVSKFAELSGDYNPMHMDEVYSKTSDFG